MIVFWWRTTLFSFPCGLWKTFPPISALIKGHIPSSLVGILAIHTCNEVAPSPWINIDGNISCASYFKAKISLLWVSNDAIKWHSQLFIVESYWSPKCMYQKRWVKYRGDQSEWLLRRWTTAILVWLCPYTVPILHNHGCLTWESALESLSGNFRSWKWCCLLLQCVSAVQSHLGCRKSTKLGDLKQVVT